MVSMTGVSFYENCHVVADGGVANGEWCILPLTLNVYTFVLQSNRGKHMWMVQSKG